MAAGRTYWAALHLLDRQVVDREGMLAAKVDDLDFVVPDEPGALPVLSAVLCGQAALARRFDHRLAGALERLRRVVDPRPEPGPGRIAWMHVSDVGTHVRLDLGRDELDVTVVDQWLARHVLSHIPGSGVERNAR